MNDTRYIGTLERDIDDAEEEYGGLHITVAGKTVAHVMFNQVEDVAPVTDAVYALVGAIVSYREWREERARYAYDVQAAA
jgi:hypothetical protein